MTPLRIPVAIVSLAVFSLFLSGCKASDVAPESGQQKVSVRVAVVDFDVLPSASPYTLTLTSNPNPNPNEPAARIKAS